MTAADVTVADVMAELDRELAQLHAFHAALTRVVGRLAQRGQATAVSAAEVASVPERKRLAAPKPAKRARAVQRGPAITAKDRRSGKVDAAGWREIERRRKAGESASTIAREFGISSSAIYFHEKTHGTTRRTKTAPAKVGKPTPAGTIANPAKLEKPRTCRSCLEETATNPCEHCFEAL